MNVAATANTMMAYACSTCGMTFSFPQWFDAQRRKDHHVFYCPAGHEHRFNDKSGEDLLREELADSARRLAFEQRQRRHAEHLLRAQKGVTTKLRQRIINGVCPCCQRSFVNLKRHMGTKHPEYGELNEK